MPETEMNVRPIDSRYDVPSFGERTTDGIKETHPYNRSFEERTIFLGTQIDDALADDVMAQLVMLESIDPDRDISIYINSPGGSFTAMAAIYDTMQFVKPEIQTVCIGQAAAAAAVLLAAGTFGKRVALPHSRILIHQPVTEGTRGQDGDLEIRAGEIRRTRDQLEEILASHSGQSIDRVRKDIERDKALTPEEAMGYGLYGLIDDVVADRNRRSPALSSR
jgi:ATP-dependent Clp protease protease subunit